MLKRMRMAWGAGLLTVGVAMSAVAAPEDDFRRGQQAYLRGDVVSAMNTLRPVAQGGHLGAQSLLASILDTADFVEDAIVFYRMAADQGDLEARVALGQLYRIGRGVPKDEKQALEHFELAADKGHLAAIGFVADAYIFGLPGAEAGRDNAKALATIKRAAAVDHLPSAEALAKAYGSGQYGLGVDNAEAERWKARALEIKNKRKTAPPKKGK